MSDIGVGNWVVCLRTHEHPRRPASVVMEGRVYQVITLKDGYPIGEPFRTYPAVRLDGDGLPENCGWHLDDFRLIGRRGAFDHLLTVDEDARISIHAHDEMLNGYPLPFLQDWDEGRKRGAW